MRSTRGFPDTIHEHRHTMVHMEGITVARPGPWTTSAGRSRRGRNSRAVWALPRGTTSTKGNTGKEEKAAASANLMEWKYDEMRMPCVVVLLWLGYCC